MQVARTSKELTTVAFYKLRQGDPFSVGGELYMVIEETNDGENAVCLVSGSTYTFGAHDEVNQVVTSLTWEYV